MSSVAPAVSALACSICYNPFEPRCKAINLQPCNHSFCEQCVTHIRQNIATPCPMCRSAITGIGMNYQFMHALEEFSKQGASLAKAEADKQILAHFQQQTKDLFESQTKKCEALYDRAIALSKENKHDEAAPIFNQILDNPFPHLGFLKCATRICLLTTIKNTRGDAQKASALFDQIVEDPNRNSYLFNRAHFIMGEIYLNNDKLVSATTCLRVLAKRSTANIHYKTIAKLHLINHGTQEEAELFFNEMIEDLSFSADSKALARLSMGIRLKSISHHYLSESTQKAITLLKQVMTDPYANASWKSRARFELGLIFGENNPADAISLLNEVIADPLAKSWWKTESRLELGEIHVNSGNTKLGIQLLKKVKNDPAASEYDQWRAKKLLPPEKCVIL